MVFRAAVSSFQNPNKTAMKTLLGPRRAPTEAESWPLCADADVVGLLQPERNTVENSKSILVRSCLISLFYLFQPPPTHPLSISLSLYLPPSFPP